MIAAELQFLFWREGGTQLQLSRQMAMYQTSSSMDVYPELHAHVRQATLIPVSIAMSVLGLCSSINKLLGDIREQHQQSGISAQDVTGTALPATAAS
jgi:hypothetical protein